MVGYRTPPGPTPPGPATTLLALSTSLLFHFTVKQDQRCAQRRRSLQEPIRVRPEQVLEELEALSVSTQHHAARGAVPQLWPSPPQSLRRYQMQCPFHARGVASAEGEARGCGGGVGLGGGEQARPSLDSWKPRKSPLCPSPSAHSSLLLLFFQLPWSSGAAAAATAPGSTNTTGGPAACLAHAATVAVPPLRRHTAVGGQSMAPRRAISSMISSALDACPPVAQGLDTLEPNQAQHQACRGTWSP